MNHREYKVVEASEVKMEDGARELLNSPQMRPYMQYIEAKVTGADPHKQIQAIAELPLDQRYVWRIASALKWAFADFEDWSVEIDRATLPQEDLKTFMGLLRSRPIQFCLFLRAFIGAEEMERVMTGAIAVAKQA